MSALSHYRILELAESPAGEYCGKLLSDFGADIIKIEHPGTGSPTRHMGPFGKGADPERSGLFAYLNTNKTSVTLDLTGEAGIATLARLLEQVDAVIDDHPPGWLESVGLDPATVPATHPALILCAITPFGQSPPEDRLHAEDLTVFHASGWGYHTPSASDGTRPPLKGAGRFLASYEAGLEGAMCIAACLHGRDENGKGQVIDISAQAVMAGRVDYVLGPMIAGDQDAGIDRTRFDLGGPAGIFACRQGYAYIWMSAPTHWQAFGTLLGNPDWMQDFPANWLERGVTPERVAECRRHIAAWLATQDRNEVAEQAQKLGLTLVPVNDASDLPKSVQFQHRGFFAEVDHPVLGRALYPTVPYQLSETPVRINAHAPLLGQDNERLSDLAAASGGAAG